MSQDRPWFKFNARDWRADPALRGCSIAARGFWIELLTLMHEAQPYGHLLIKGRAPTPVKLAAMTGVLTDEVSALLAELEEAAVFSRTEEGVIYSRRMVRDEAASASGAGNVRRKWGSSPPEAGDETVSNSTMRSRRMAEARRLAKHTPEEWLRLVDIFGRRCVRCEAFGVEIVKDHIKPIYQGGSDGIENLQPLCRTCNAKKGQETTDWRNTRDPSWRQRFGPARRHQTPTDTTTKTTEDRDTSSAASAREAPKIDVDDGPLSRCYAAAGPGLADPARCERLHLTAPAIAAALAAGCDLDADVLPVIRAKTAEARASPITTWKYFRDAWAEARDARLALSRFPESPPETIHDLTHDHDTQIAAGAHRAGLARATAAARRRSKPGGILGAALRSEAERARVLRAGGGAEGGDPIVDDGDA